MSPYFCCHVSLWSEMLSSAKERETLSPLMQPRILESEEGEMGKISFSLRSTHTYYLI